MAIMTNRCCGLRHLIPLLLTTAVLLTLLPMPGRAQEYRIQANASPSRVVYGEDNNVTIRVSVVDSDGKTVEEGTAVYFRTTLGAIPSVAYTRNGQVNVTLENTQGPGRAMVTISSGAGQSILYVEYLGQGGEVTAQTGRIHYRAKAIQVYYSIDQRVLDMCDMAEFSTPSFTVHATKIQFDLKNELLKAQYGVTLTVNDTTISGESLVLEVSANRGTLRMTEPDIRYANFTLPSLELVDDEAARTVDFRPLNPLPTNTWIICREVTIFPQEQLQFRRPEFYLNNFDHRLFTLPYHVLDLRSSAAGTFFNSKITVTSDAGLDIDIPVFYAASSNRIGSLHLRNVNKGSSFFKGATGMQLSLEEEYLLGDDGDGALYLDDLTRPTRSLSWNHAHDFGKTHINVDASYDRSVETNPYNTYVGMTLSRSLGMAPVNLSTNWNAFKGSQNGFAEVKASLPPLKLGGSGFDLGFSPYLGYTRDVTAAVTTETETTPESTETNFYQGLTTNIGVPSFSVLGGIVSTSVSNDLSREGDGEIGDYLGASVNYRRRLSSLFSLSLNHSYGISYSSDGGSWTDPTQRMSIDISGSKSQTWYLYTNASYSLNDSLLSGSANITYYLPWERSKSKDPLWNIRYRSNFTSGDTVTADHLISLSRRVGNQYTIVLHYSPTGNTSVTGLGTGTGKQFAIELVRQGW